MTLSAPCLARAVLVVSLQAGAVGCAAYTSSTPTKLTAFDASRIPPGDAFVCYERVIGKDKDSLCFRTDDECNAEHDQAKAREDVASVGVCEKQSTAACYVAHREKTGGVVEDPGQLGDKPACFRTMAECQAVQKTWADAKPPGISEVTACGEVSRSERSATASAPVKTATPTGDDWRNVTLDPRPAPEPSRNPRLASVSRTPAGELRSFTEEEANAAMTHLEAGQTSWEEAAKRVVAKLGKPAYALTPSRRAHADEDWYWVSSSGDKKCVTAVLTRRKDRLDAFGPVGDYAVRGDPAHVTEEIQQGEKGHLHVCEGLVTAKAR